VAASFAKVASAALIAVSRVVASTCIAAVVFALSRSLVNTALELTIDALRVVSAVPSPQFVTALANAVFKLIWKEFVAIVSAVC